MQIFAETPKEYIQRLPEFQRETMKLIRETILANLPEGFEEVMSSGMIGYVVSFTVFPEGYHVKPKQPLPFMGLAAQKNNVTFYHMGVYSMDELLRWFVERYAALTGKKPDMGKSCIRFKKTDKIPLELIGELVSKVSAEDYVGIYKKMRNS
ncbi:MAG: DUF1801 domain-containing protein [Saccharofermentanales bacterium]